MEPQFVKSTGFIQTKTINYNGTEYVIRLSANKEDIGKYFLFLQNLNTKRNKKYSLQYAEISEFCTISDKPIFEIIPNTVKTDILAGII